MSTCRKVAAAAVLGALLAAGGCGGGDAAGQGGVSGVTSYPRGAPAPGGGSAGTGEVAPVPHLEPCPAGAAGTGAPAGLPDLTLPCLAGGPDVRLADLRGRPVLLNVWATWCGPCVAEIPALQELHERAGDQLLVLGVNYTDDPSQVGSFAARLGMTYPSVVDHDGELRSYLRVPALPVTALYDADGNLVHTEVRSMDEVDEFVDLVKEHLAVTL